MTYLFSLTLTVSITYTTSGMVTLVSAIFVDTDVPDNWRDFIERNKVLGRKLSDGEKLPEPEWPL